MSILVFLFCGCAFVLFVSILFYFFVSGLITFLLYHKCHVWIFLFPYISHSKTLSERAKICKKIIKRRFLLLKSTRINNWSNLNSLLYFQINCFSRHLFLPFSDVLSQEIMILLSYGSLIQIYWSSSVTYLSWPKKVIWW